MRGNDARLDLVALECVGCARGGDAVAVGVIGVGFDVVHTGEPVRAVINQHLRGGDSGEQGGGHGRRDVLEAVREQGIAEHAIAFRGVALVVAVVVEEGLTVEIDLVQTILAIGIEQVSEGYRAELGLAGSQW